MDILKQFGIIPIDFSTLISTLGDYKSPKDKVMRIEEAGYLVRLKKGLFVVTPKVHGQTLSTELIANHLYGPSYVSFESALSFYKIIPERVYTVKSASLKRSKNFTTPLGHFDYIQINPSYYSIGLRQEIYENKYAFVIATPEKALCDMIISTKGIRIQSAKAMQIFLEEDLRVDLSALKNVNLEIIKACATISNKRKPELMLLYNLLSNEPI